MPGANDQGKASALLGDHEALRYEDLQPKRQHNERQGGAPDCC